MVDVLWGARILPSKATSVSPYLLLFHRPLEVPLPGALQGYMQEELVGEEGEEVLAK